MASSTKKNMEIREFARRFVRVVQIEDGDVILLRTDDIDEKLDIFNGLRSALGMQGKRNCLIIAVSDLEALTTLSEASMAEYGWYRKENANESSVHPDTE
jgi:hypothetical protein